MSSEARKGWRWRVADKEANKNLNLLYEPGNWGDVLKGIWATVTARALSSRLPEGTFRYFDPFAGTPTYALVEASHKRLESVPAPAFVELQRPYVEKGTMASTALLARDVAVAQGVTAQLEIFDSDPGRVEAWRQCEEARVLNAASGEEALGTLARRGSDRKASGSADSPPWPHFVLVDPYDFFVRWAQLLPAILGIMTHSTVLIYSYNKAPRGPGQFRLSEDFRKALRAGLGERKRALVARVPADASLARAYHEVLLLGPAVEAPGLEEELASSARALARSIAESGAFEVLRG